MVAKIQGICRFADRASNPPCKKHCKYNVFMRNAAKRRFWDHTMWGGGGGGSEPRTGNIYSHTSSVRIHHYDYTTGCQWFVWHSPCFSNKKEGSSLQQHLINKNKNPRTIRRCIPPSNSCFSTWVQIPRTRLRWQYSHDFVGPVLSYVAWGRKFQNGCVFGRLVCWLFGCLVGWLVGWLVDWLFFACCLLVVAWCFCCLLLIGLLFVACYTSLQTILYLSQHMPTILDEARFWFVVIACFWFMTHMGVNDIAESKPWT